MAHQMRDSLKRLRQRIKRGPRPDSDVSRRRFIDDEPFVNNQMVPEDSLPGAVRDVLEKFKEEREERERRGFVEERFEPRDPQAGPVIG